MKGTFRIRNVRKVPFFMTLWQLAVAQLRALVEQLATR
jgi:hypothetical protein